MALATFGIVFTSVKEHYFPQLRGDFSASSNPKAATVTEMISDEASDLAGKLAAEGVSAAAIDAAQPTYPNAYAWCAKTLRLAAAIRVFPAMTGQDPEVLKAWRRELKDRFEDLEENGFTTLGDAPAPTLGSGMRSHILDLSLEVQRDSDASTSIPVHRRDDLL